MFPKEYYRSVPVIYPDLVILAWYQFILPPNLVLYADPWLKVLGKNNGKVE